MFISKDKYDTLMNSVKQLEDRLKILEDIKKKTDRDADLIKQGFMLTGQPRDGSVVLVKYLEDEGYLRERFFEKYTPERKWYPFMGKHYDVPVYAWKEVCPAVKLTTIKGNK